MWNPEGWLNQLGVMDFAGGKFAARMWLCFCIPGSLSLTLLFFFINVGLVIHSSTGVAGFVVSVLLQRRKLHSLALAHHNLPLSFVGAALVWSGWYSFNAGSAYRADTQAAVALYNTHISACSGSLAWSLLSYKESGKWSLVRDQETSILDIWFHYVLMHFLLARLSASVERLRAWRESLRHLDTSSLGQQSSSALSPAFSGSTRFVSSRSSWS